MVVPSGESLQGKDAGLAKSNGSLSPGDDLKVTCGLSACTPGSAPGPALGNECGITYLCIHGYWCAIVSSSLSTDCWAVSRDLFYLLIIGNIRDVHVSDFRCGVIWAHASERRLHSLLFLLQMVSARLQTRYQPAWSHSLLSTIRLSFRFFAFIGHFFIF